MALIALFYSLSQQDEEPSNTSGYGWVDFTYTHLAGMAEWLG